MDTARDILQKILQILGQLGEMVMDFILKLELWLRDQLGGYGISHNVQTIILLATALLLILAALRLFGGLIRLAVVVLLLILAINILMPVFQG